MFHNTPPQFLRKRHPLQLCKPCQGAACKSVHQNGNTFPQELFHILFRPLCRVQLYIHEYKFQHTWDEPLLCILVLGSPCTPLPCVIHKMTGGFPGKFVSVSEYSAALSTWCTALLGLWCSVVHVAQFHDEQIHGIVHDPHHGNLHGILPDDLHGLNPV